MNWFRSFSNVFYRELDGIYSNTQLVIFCFYAVVTSSLPCVFVSGNLFPWQDIPVYMQAFAALMPSTPGVDAMLRASQAGASPLEIFPYLMHLLALGLLYFSIAWLLAKKCGQDYLPAAKLAAEPD